MSISKFHKVKISENDVCHPIVKSDIRNFKKIIIDDVTELINDICNCL